MKTWSLAKLGDDFWAGANQAITFLTAPLLDAFYPPLTHDADRPVDGAEALAEAEEQQEVWDGGDIDMPIIRSGKRPVIEDVEGQEPQLSGTELVALRQLIEERFGDQTLPPLPGIDSWMSTQTLKADRLDAEMWRATVGADEEPTPAERVNWRLNKLFQGPVDPQPDSAVSDLNAADTSPGVDSFPPNPPGEPPLAVWLEPAVLEILSGHSFFVERGDKLWDYTYHCVGLDGARHQTFPSAGYPGAVDDWNQHVAPLIAEHIARCLSDFPGRINQPT